MRYVVDCNPKKRGCDICADVVTRTFWSENDYKYFNRKCCPYDECPYHELDDVKCYSEYDKRVKKKLNLKKIFNVSEK